MSALLERALAYLRSRSPRERWALAAAALVVLVLILHTALIRPLQADIGEAEARIADLEGKLLRATRMAGDLRRLQGALSPVEERIEPGARTNLFTLLENLAEQAQIKDQLESIKPKQASTNARYPETRVEVSLKGASLAQTVNFLYLIETAPMHLIVRSIRLKSRGAERLLDVSFSVSSFERA